MQFAESLANLQFVACIAANVIVAYYAHEAWRARRLQGFLVLAISASIGVFVGVAQQWLQHRHMSQQDYYLLWCLITGLSIADMILYAGGIVMVVRHFMAEPRP